jgi:hypothetical protein
MSLISAVKTYLKTYSSLKSGAPVWVDFLGSKPTQYAVMPLAGGRIVEEYLNGSSLREYPFAFQSMESTADELERLETEGFYEAFAAWLESQTASGSLPTLASGQTAESIEATGWGYLYQTGESQTGVYQIQCRLTYTQE